MNCNRIQQALDAMADGELGRWKSWRIVRHLARCPACAAVWVETQRLGEQARAWRLVSAPPELKARIAAALAASSSPADEPSVGTARRSPARGKERLWIYTTRWGWIGAIVAVLILLWAATQHGGDALAAAIRATEAAPAIHWAGRGSLGTEFEAWFVGVKGSSFRANSGGQRIVEIDDLKQTYSYRSSENRVYVGPTMLGDAARAADVGGTYTLTGVLRQLQREHKPEAIQVERVAIDGRHLLRVTARGYPLTLFVEPQSDRVVLMEGTLQIFPQKPEWYRATVEYPDPATVDPSLFHFTIPPGATVVDQRPTAVDQCTFHLLMLKAWLLAYVTDHHGQWPRALRPDLDPYVFTQANGHKADQIFYCPLDRGAKGKATSYLYYRPARPVDPAELARRWNMFNTRSAPPIPPRIHSRTELIIECPFHDGLQVGLYRDGLVFAFPRGYQPQRMTPEQQCYFNLMQLKQAMLSYVTDHHGRWPQALRPDLELYVNDNSVFYCPLDRTARGKTTSYRYHRPTSPVDPAKLADRWNAPNFSPPETSKRAGFLIECPLHAGWERGLYRDGRVMGIPLQSPGSQTP